MSPVSVDVLPQGLVTNLIYHRSAKMLTERMDAIENTKFLIITFLFIQTFFSYFTLIMHNRWIKIKNLDVAVLCLAKLVQLSITELICVKLWNCKLPLDSAFRHLAGWTNKWMSLFQIISSYPLYSSVAFNNCSFSY